MFLAVKDLFKYISSAENTSVEFAFSSSNMPALTTILNGITVELQWLEHLRDHGN